MDGSLPTSDRTRGSDRAQDGRRHDGTAVRDPDGQPPGELAYLARTLGQRGVNIAHISCAGAGSVACAFITTSDEKATHDVLKTLGHEILEGETVVVDVLDKPGGFADVAEQLADAGVHILGTMCVGRREGILEMAFAVDDAVKAREALPKAELAGIG